MLQGCKITKGNVTAYTVPTDAPEEDGTFSWSSTTMVLVTLHAGGEQGIGYTYADAATGKLVQSLLEKVVRGRDLFDHGAILQAMYTQVRNSGETSVTSMAISAIDNALWDLRARVLNIPLVSLLGSSRYPGLREWRLHLL